MFTHTHSRLFSTSGGRSITGSVTAEGGAEIMMDEPVADGASGALVAMSLDVSQCKAFFLKSDQALTVKTNSNGAPANTFTLVAGKPFSWVSGNGDAWRDTSGTAVATDITGLYVTNASGEPARFQLAVLLDPTV